jgi:hypothetical protein
LDEYFYFVDELEDLFSKEGFSVSVSKLSKNVWYMKSTLGKNQ